MSLSSSLSMEVRCGRQRRLSMIGVSVRPNIERNRRLMLTYALGNTRRLTVKDMQ